MDRYGTVGVGATAGVQEEVHVNGSGTFYRPRFPEKTDLVKLTIDTVEHKQIAVPPRCHPYAHEDFVQKKLEPLQKAGIIRESSSPWMAPIVIVKQRGKARFATDNIS